jgi:hypothetical protein
MEVVPHVGIGKVRLGMGLQEAERLKGPEMGLDTAGSPPLVAFIEVDRRSGAHYRGIDLFDVGADEVVAAIARAEGLDPRYFPPGKHHYRFPALNLLLWRGYVSDDPDDRQGFFFQSASVYSPGYYQGRYLEFLLRETTHFDGSVEP